MFQKYKYVLAVYQEQSFTKAAQKLFISQPSLSVAIRNIEKEIGQPLFERCGFSAKPTEIGRAYIAAARKMRLAEEEFEKKCADINDLQTGRLTVGGSNYLTSDVLPQIITRFRESFPNVEITLVEANSVRLRDMLGNEEVDMIIDNFEETTGLYEKFPLANERILLCVPQDRPINRQLEQFQISPDSIYDGTVNVAQIPPVAVSLFKDEKFVLLKNGHDMYERSTAIFERCGIVPDISFRVDQLNISYALAQSGMGACFVTDTVFKHRRHVGDVVLYKPDAQHTNRMLYLAYKKNRYCTRAMSEFIRTAQETIQD